MRSALLAIGQAWLDHLSDLAADVAGDGRSELPVDDLLAEIGSLMDEAEAAAAEGATPRRKGQDDGGL